MKWIFEQHALEEEGRRLEKAGDFAKALEKYQLASSYGIKIWAGTKLASAPNISNHVIGVLQKQRRYQEALNGVKQVRSYAPKSQHYIDWEKELEALVEYQKKGDPAPAYKYIEWYKQKNKEGLPPAGYWVTPVTTLLRLYDTIGDYDAGIAYVDECLEYFKQQDIKKYGEYRPGHVDEEYIKVREAFEQDKREGTRGRATKALIQSDYFPW
ncbi:MAG: hypothetical protein HY559_06040 [Gammaproteobacteria bacterium]|nr:hypothetical protein [Gammaproteobacteria bacterium]